MRKLVLLLIVSGLFFACAKDDEAAPFVTDVVIVDPEVTYAPGDEVRITASGFEPDDQIMLRISWPLSGGPSGEGYADGVWAVVKAHTATDITFLAPGRYPASTVEIKLFRQGQAMSLGQISVSDGQSPVDFSLYGIVDSDTEETSIVRIDMTSGAVTPVKTLGAGQKLCNVVNAPGTNSIYGVSSRGNGAAVCYDLTMRYYRSSGNDHVVSAGAIGNSPAFLRSKDGRIAIDILNTRTSVQQPVTWQLPDGISAAMLGDCPFVFGTNSHLLLSAHTAEGFFRPVVFDTGNPGGKGTAGDVIEADAMIPFRMLRKSAIPEVGTVWVCGYAVAKNGTTRLTLFDPLRMADEDEVAEIPGTALSVAVIPVNGGTVKIYLLCDDGGNAGRRIREYDSKTGLVTTLPGAVTCSEIVVAR